MKDKSADFAETRKELAVDQIDGDPFDGTHLGGYPGDLPAGDDDILVEEELP